MTDAFVDIIEWEHKQAVQRAWCAGQEDMREEAATGALELLDAEAAEFTRGSPGGLCYSNAARLVQKFIRSLPIKGKPDE